MSVRFGTFENEHRQVRGYKIRKRHGVCQESRLLSLALPAESDFERGMDMTQDEKRSYLITELKKESPQYAKLSVPGDVTEQKLLLRALFNVRAPMAASGEFLKIQDEYLKAEIRQKGITDIGSLKAIQTDIYLWQGDITTLGCDAIVNAANSALLGCFCPNHGCIDNAVHTFAGIELRLACNEIMQKQGYGESVGRAKITPAYNLPCRFIIHTVGPFICGKPTDEDCKLLRACYRSCLKIADENSLKSIAFCCISAGEFHFPNDKAAEIAVNAVREYKAETQSKIKVIFDVFKDKDYEIYRKLLG